MGIKALDAKDFLKGLTDVLSESRTVIGYDEAKQLIDGYFVELQSQQNEINKHAGDEFLRINREKKGVTELPSGLQYEILRKASGAKPKAADKVKCHYHGTLINGTVFDSSVRRGEPALFNLSQLIPGWTEALQLMTVGSKWRLFIPPHLAYGTQGAGDVIGPNSTLVFELELLDIIQSK